MLDTVFKKSLSSSQLRGLERFGNSINKFGISFAVCNTDGELVLLCDNCHSSLCVEEPCEGPPHQKRPSEALLVLGTQSRGGSSREELMEAARKTLHQSSEGDCVGTDGDVETIPVIYKQGQILATVLRSASASDRRREAVGVALIAPVSGKQEEYLKAMLGLLAENFQAGAEAEREIEMVSTELAQVYEELVLLHKLSTNMRVTEADSNFLQRACDSLTDIVLVEGIAILLEKTIEDEKRLVLTAGSGLIDIDERMAAILHNRLVEEMNSGKEALLDSEVDSPFRYDWANSVKNIIAVPLCIKDKRGARFSGKAQSDNCIIGLMVAINRIDKPDFDSTDVKLFNSVANGCAVFVENNRLFKDLKELFIGSLKAMTSSIDAKDQYTRGHSERVAFISRWIAERLAEKGLLEEEQIHRVYLAGLLHDIGKIGIDEVVLRKRGKLTGQELSRMRVHPSIGAGILEGIKQMHDIVPGILYHHERVDGEGYPNGLVGEQIPLIGKIVGLADGFDAMTSKRTYRSAMTVKQALAEIEKGLGTQFDEKVGRVFINSDVYQLWGIMQDGFGKIHGDNKSVEYGTVAVGSIIG